MKLVRQEEKTTPLRDWLGMRHEKPVITSVLGRIEVLRAARRVGGPVLAQARVVVGGLDLVPLDRAVQDIACEIADPSLRTLDALHLASALVLREDLTAFITYDHRLAVAAREVGLHVTTPGQH